MVSKVSTNSRILAAAKVLSGETPFSTRQLVTKLWSENLDLKSISYDTLRGYVSKNLTGAGYHKGMVGQVSHWHIEPFWVPRAETASLSDPPQRARLARHKILLATLYYTFKTDPFTTTQAADLIEETCPYTQKTSMRYTNLVLGSAFHEPTEIAGRSLMARKIRNSGRGKGHARRWELYYVE